MRLGKEVPKGPDSLSAAIRSGRQHEAWLKVDADNPEGPSEYPNLSRSASMRSEKRAGSAPRKQDPEAAASSEDEDGGRMDDDDGGGDEDGGKEEGDEGGW